MTLPSQRDHLVIVEKPELVETGKAAKEQDWVPVATKWMKRTRRGIGNEIPATGEATETHLFEALDGKEGINATMRLRSAVSNERFAIESIDFPGDGRVLIFARLDNKQ